MPFVLKRYLDSLYMVNHDFKIRYYHQGQDFNSSIYTRSINGTLLVEAKSQ